MPGSESSAAAWQGSKKIKFAELLLPGMEDKKEQSAENLKKQYQECQKLKDEYLAGWQRARADLLNYKKEEMQRVGDILKYAGEGLILRMLPILDNFEIALKNLPDKGFSQIKKQLQDFLKEQGVEEIKSVGEKFNPNLHEVVAEVEPASAPAAEKALAGKEASSGEAGTVLEEIQKGYKINGRLLRPAKVKVVK